MELNKLDVLQAKGRRNVSRDGEAGKGCRHKHPERGEMRVPTVVVNTFFPCCCNAFLAENALQGKNAATKNNPKKTHCMVPRWN